MRPSVSELEINRDVGYVIIIPFKMYTYELFIYKADILTMHLLYYLWQ